MAILKLFLRQPEKAPSAAPACEHASKPRRNAAGTYPLDPSFWLDELSRRPRIG